MKNQFIKDIAQLNIALLFISTSGVLGRYITIPPPITIWWRCLFAAIFLGMFCWYKKINLKILTSKDFKTILLSGIFFGIHWITYFYALQLSNVAIGMLSLFSYPVITTLLEPLFLKTKVNGKHVLLGILIIIGVYFLTPEFNIENNYTKGIIFGVVSAVFYAMRNILLKKKIAHYHGSMLMFYQMVIITFILWPVFFFYENNPSTNDWTALITLAFITTAIGHTLFVMSFKKFSIGTVSIMSSIQLIYGILLGILFLNEVPSGRTILGGLLILSTVIIEGLQSQKSEVKNSLSQQ